MSFASVISLALVGLGTAPAADAGQRVTAVYEQAAADWQTLADLGIRINFTEVLAFHPDTTGKASTRCVGSGVAKYLGKRTREDYTTDYDRQAIVERTALLFDGGMMKKMVTYVPRVFTVGSASGRVPRNGVIKRYGVIQASLDRRLTGVLTSGNVALTLLHPDEWVTNFGVVNRTILERRRRDGRMAEIMTHTESTDHEWTVLTSHYADPRLHRSGGIVDLVRKLFLDPETGLPMKATIEGSGCNVVCELGWDTVQLPHGGTAGVLTRAVVSYPGRVQPAMSYEYRYLAHEVRVGDVDPEEFSLEFPEGLHVIDRVNDAANAQDVATRPEDRK